MDSGIIIALIGLAGIGIPAYFLFKTSNATLKSQKETLAMTLQNQKDLATIAANQTALQYSHEKVTEKVEEYHKEVNGRMGELIETTKKLGEAVGKAEEKANPS